MTLKNNRAPLLSNIKLCASFHHHMWIQTGVTVRKRLSWVLTSVTLTFDLWPWPFAWTLLWSLVITPENFMMIRWWEHSEKGGTDGQTDGQTDNTICRAAWSQLKTYRLKTFADLRRRWRSCVTRIGHTAAADVPVDSCIQLSHLYASVPPVSFWCSWISWSSRNFRQRSWLHCGSTLIVILPSRILSTHISNTNVRISIPLSISMFKLCTYLWFMTIVALWISLIALWVKVVEDTAVLIYRTFFIHNWIIHSSSMHYGYPWFSYIRDY